MLELWLAFIDFFRFAPRRLSLCFFLMLFQSLSAGLGLLFLIPLLQLIGFDLAGNGNGGFAVSVGRFFDGLGFTLTLPVVLIAYVLIISAIAISQYYLSILSATVKEAYIRSMRLDLYRSLLHTRWQFVASHKMSDFSHALISQVSSVANMANQILNMLSQLFLAGVYIVFAMLLSWQMCVLALACASGLLLALLPFNRLSLQTGRTMRAGSRSIFQMIGEQLSSLKMIKSYASEAFYFDKIQAVSFQLGEQAIRIARIGALTRLIYAVGAAISFSVFFYIAIEWLSVPLPTLLLLLLIISRLLPRFSGLQSGFQRLLHQLPAFEDVKSIMDQCMAAQESDGSTVEKMPQLTDQIRLDHVSFRYQGGSRQVIRDLSLRIKKDQSVALVGPSGAGKSTLADLIAGLLEPDSGSIYCDHIKLEHQHLLAWRKGLAYITQEVFLFHDTVRANLNWVAPDVSDDELWQVLKLAAAEDFVKALPQGLDSVIGDRGLRLSGGERQRLALARALLSRPQLLILDEATSALDHDNEQKIQLALEHLQGKLTIIIIAHRETTIEHVDATIRLGIPSEATVS